MCQKQDTDVLQTVVIVDIKVSLVLQTFPFLIETSYGNIKDSSVLFFIELETKAH